MLRVFLKRSLPASIAVAAVVFLRPVSSAAQFSPRLSLFSDKTGSPAQVEGNKVQIIEDAGVFYDELQRSIRNATDFILMEYYTFRDDSISTVILDALAQKARQGVRTCLILDRFGCSEHFEEKGNRLRMSPFRRGYLQSYLDSGVDIAFYNNDVPLPRDHRKLTLVDGKVAFIGGMNITDLYLNGIGGVGKFWDMSIKIEGPAVSSFNFGFLRMWNSCGDRPLGVSFPEAPAACGDVPLILLETQGSGIHPNPEELYSELFAMAQHSIRFITGYFTPTRAIVNSLRDAAQRGVDIQMLMGSSTDMPPAFDKVMMQQALDLAHENCLTLFIQEGGFHHEKAICIDGHLILIGSHNLDRLSIKTNHEISVLMDSPDVAGDFNAYFDAHAHPDI